MFAVGVIVLVVLWVLWLIPFLLKPRGTGEAVVVKAPAARWGMVLQAASFAITWLHGPSSAWLVIPAWRLAATVLFGLIAVALSSTAVRALGKQFRFDAALGSNHELVRSGPYRVVRHPMYASMLAILLATGFAVSGWLQFAIAVLVFCAGTEIRVRVEERLLAGRFGPDFEHYRAGVPAYLPYVR